MLCSRRLKIGCLVDMTETLFSLIKMLLSSAAQPPQTQLLKRNSPKKNSGSCCGNVLGGGKILVARGVLRSPHITTAAEVSDNGAVSRRGAHPYSIVGRNSAGAPCCVLLGSVQRLTTNSGQQQWLQLQCSSRRDAVRIQPGFRRTVLVSFLLSQLPHRAAGTRQDCERPRRL